VDSHRKSILGVPVDTYRQEDFFSEVEKVFQDGRTRTIFAVNPEKIMLAQKDLELFSALKEADFLIPDGIGVIVALMCMYGGKLSQLNRVSGIELMQYILDLANNNRYRIFIFGSSPQVNSGAATRIQNLYPFLVLAGSNHGYITEKDNKLLIEKINSLDVDVLFVGLGSPKQEKWIHQHKRILKIKICMGIGGSLDVYAGKISRAPTVMRILGLEWFYRLIRQPSRIKRQMVLFKFVLEVIKEMASCRNYK